MVSIDDGMVGSWLSLVPPIRYVEARFDIPNGLEYLRNYWFSSVICSILYLTIIFGGQYVMAERPAFSLRKPLILWNIGLAIFSIFGIFSNGPRLFHDLYSHGFTYSICHANTILDKHQALWGFLFVLSKPIEFGDTFFLILRKKPVMFLHWYHHITVCVYSFCLMAGGVSSDIARWFGCMNFTIHSIMYSYYALRAAGYYVPSRVALLITILQLSQMFVGIFINVSVYKLNRQGEKCGMSEHYFYVGMCIYGSYALLFLHFFIKRYCCSSKKKHE